VRIESVHVLTVLIFVAVFMESTELRFMVLISLLLEDSFVFLAGDCGNI